MTSPFLLAVFSLTSAFLVSAQFESDQTSQSPGLPHWAIGVIAGLVIVGIILFAIILLRNECFTGSGIRPTLRWGRWSKFDRRDETDGQVAPKNRQNGRYQSSPTTSRRLSTTSSRGPTTTSFFHRLTSTAAVVFTSTMKFAASPTSVHSLSNTSGHPTTPSSHPVTSAAARVMTSTIKSYVTVKVTPNTTTSAAHRLSASQ
ncbi:hypothetical protein DACRYDRAFT_117757 [Dacryopinax primogenitus]|uniref:Uncharacterized protein n=1 Tax=Dacryopinax primogenitus (strain DJM 731) TaxID=1858805 RepID=M5G127_DACPD|nr:uncharacterized protein DACRYDRAFT_117757 [Dacryopinax primogenitus]EJT99526.1 hypothetical protein DACRYDRAFT_117757 [Dacryopinax primogenitus]